MNVNQARDLYSSYYEGTLDSSGAASFEAMLANDAEMRLDYQAFAGIMDSLPLLGNEAIEVPHNLHDSIMQKLDQHDWETKNRTSKLSLAQWPKLLYGGAAAALLLFAGYAVLGPKHPAGPTTEAGLGGVVDTRIHPSFEVHDGTSLRLVVKGSRVGTLTVQAVDGSIKKDFDLGKADVDEALMNNSDDAQIVTVSGKGVDDVRIALPGKVRKQILTGDGTADDCAKAIASTFGTPVEIEGKPEGSCHWVFTEKDSSSTLVGALDKVGVRASITAGGLLRINAGQ